MRETYLEESGHTWCGQREREREEGDGDGDEAREAKPPGLDRCACDAMESQIVLLHSLLFIEMRFY